MTLNKGGQHDTLDSIEFVNSSPICVLEIEGQLTYHAANDAELTKVPFRVTGALFANAATSLPVDTDAVRGDAVWVSVVVERVRLPKNPYNSFGLEQGHESNYFADITGDGADDAIIVNPDGVHVIANTGKQSVTGSHFAGAAINWGGFLGKAGNYFADVNGDGKADLIAVDWKGLVVSLSTGGSFAPYEYWTRSQFIGLGSNYFADIDGDGKADAIRSGPIDYSDRTPTFEARISTGTSFGKLTNLPLSLAVPLKGSRGWFADVTGPDSDGKSRADFTYFAADGVWVNQNWARGFFGSTRWLAPTWTPAGIKLVPALPLIFADINGDGKQDYVGTNPNATYPLRDVIYGYHSNGSGSFDPAPWEIRPSMTKEKGIYAAKLSTASNVRSVVWVNTKSVYAWDKESSHVWDLTNRPYYSLR